MTTNFQAIIIGGGPAGVSAALYLARANISTAIIENGPGALARAHKIDNYYGISASGIKMYAEGLEQAAALGATIIQDEVLAVEYTGSYMVTLKNTAEPLTAPVIILATGTKNISLAIEGLAALEGRGISYCAVCDGFFFRKKKVAVVGNGPYALHEADHLKHLAASVTILTNGKDDRLAKETGFATITTPLTKVSGDGKLEAVHFDDGTTLEADGLFLALGTADSTDLARKLGAQLKERYVAIDEQGATNVPGLFAAGDCTGGLRQVAKAVYEGSLAGMSAVKYIRNL